VAAKPAVLGQWVHLTGVYDSPSRQLRLYVNGEFSGVAKNVSAPPDAKDATTIGRGQFEAKAADFFPGLIDEVRTEQGAAPEADIAQRGGWPAPPAGQLGRFVNGAADHYTDSTSKPVRPGYHYEGSFGQLVADGPNTKLLYACLFGSDAFTSVQSDCEGKTVLGEIGRVYTVKPTNVATQPVYRCNRGADHMESWGSDCEGATNEGLLGYTVAYAPLTRYYSADNRDHWTTVHGVAPSYKSEGVQGLLPQVQLPGTVPLQSCLVDTDEFASLDMACEGKTYIATIGYLYSAAPEGVATAPIYRCVVNGQKYTSRSATCEGYTVDKLLGYIPTSLPAVEPTFP
jgi:hypothetical protein